MGVDLKVRGVGESIGDDKVAGWKFGAMGCAECAGKGLIGATDCARRDRLRRDARDRSDVAQWVWVEENFVTRTIRIGLCQRGLGIFRDEGCAGVVVEEVEAGAIQ